MLSGTKTVAKDAAVGGGSSSICLHGAGCGGWCQEAEVTKSLDLKQTDRRNGGSRRLDADATAEERQGGLETISETVQSTLLDRTRLAELPWKLAAGHT